MGHIQNTGGLLTDPIFAEAPQMLSVLAKFMPGFGIKQLATRSIGWWVQTADLPDLDNRVRLIGNRYRGWELITARWWGFWRSL
nr:hypothetical protein [Chamaesiphon sp. OTE_75_metabat_556]